MTGAAQLDEMRRVSRYPKIKAILLNTLPPLPNSIEADDPNDTFLLAMSLAGDADYLVTGDRRAGLLQCGSIGRTRIVTPITFCDEAL